MRVYLSPQAPAFHSQSLTQNSESSALVDDVKHALLSRIRLRKDLLVVTSPDSPLDQQEDEWSMVRQNLKAVEASHSLGISVTDAFSSKIQRRLASTVPPRPVVELPFAEACRVLLELCQDNLEVVRGTKLQTLSPQEIVVSLTASYFHEKLLNRPNNDSPTSGSSTPASHSPSATPAPASQTLSLGTRMKCTRSSCERSSKSSYSPKMMCLIRSIGPSNSPRIRLYPQTGGPSWPHWSTISRIEQRRYVQFCYVEQQSLTFLLLRSVTLRF